MVFCLSVDFRSVLIETYWNVKTQYYASDSIHPLVLIETYWNVKTESLNSSRTVVRVLIETYWNVKVVAAGKTFTLRFRINRNILECKVTVQMLMLRPHGVLIETYWNVKTGFTTAVVAGSRINRNILECKDLF